MSRTESKVKIEGVYMLELELSLANLDARGFSQKKVWQALTKPPYGKQHQL